MNNISFTIDYSRIFFDPFDQTNDRDPNTGKAGIRIHGWLTALVCRILSVLRLTSGILTVNLNEQVIHLNKGSFEKWCERHDSIFDEHDDVLSKIDEIVTDFIQKQDQEKEAKFKKLEQIQDIALDHLKKMASICYNSDGRLNTVLLKESSIFKNLQLKDCLFENEIFNQYLNANEDLDKNLESFFTAYPLKSKTTFYHGTSVSNAKKIKEKGFNPLAPTVHGTESGAGTYLTEQREVALNFAKRVEQGLLSCQIKFPIKIVRINPEEREWLNGIFRSLISSYVRQNQAAIVNDLKTANVADISLSLDFETKLWDLFVRDFFLRLGYRGLYTEHSSFAGCSYLNLFDPQQDIIAIN